LNLHGFYPTGT